nr:immunoglobulin light chain junction region [Macaca mulatta]
DFYCQSGDSSANLPVF